MLRRVLILVVLVAVLGGCAGEPARPRPEVFRSPLAARERERIFFPYVARPVNKLGTAGCPRNQWPLGIAWCYSWHPAPTLAARARLVHWLCPSRMYSPHLK